MKGCEEIVTGRKRSECGYARLSLLGIGLLRTAMASCDGLPSLAKGHRRVELATTFATLDECIDHIR